MSDDDMNRDITIAALRKNAREDLRVQLHKFNGKNLISARVWTEKDDGTQVPTRKGVTLRLELLPDLLKALHAAEREAVKAGLLVNGHASHVAEHTASVTSRTRDACGDTFEAKRKDARYCSVACRKRGSRARQSAEGRP
jgi:hypothetical protein